MMKHLILFAGLCGLSAVLNGCGGGGTTPAPGTTQAPTPQGPTTPAPPPPGPCPCPASLTRGHCSTCTSDGKAISCTACTGGYKPNSAATDKHLADQVCTMKCAAAAPKPPYPKDAMGHNGVVWPTLCQDDASKGVFFGLGDWGGMCGYNGAKCVKGVTPPDCKYKYHSGALPGMPCTFPLRPPQIPEIEGQVQIKIANRMKERYAAQQKAGAPHQFVLNVGDSFYPGGVDVHCGSNSVEATTENQFEMVWKQVYAGDLTDKLDWMGVLGNHDYGGMCYVKGWDQEILYTWKSDTWVMPGQYWMRSVQYSNMKIDIFFVDGSWADTIAGGGGAGPTGFKHNICQGEDANTKKDKSGNFVCKGYQPDSGNACGTTGPYNNNGCESWFEGLWVSQYKWLTDKVANSDADWQIVVTHYPGAYNLGHSGLNQVDWTKWGPAHGVDLILSGHKHYQRIYSGDFGRTFGNWPETVNVVTGGGGGITSDGLTLTRDGQDDNYGFMEFHVTLAEIEIRTYSAGGIKNAMIMRNSTIVKPVGKKPHDEIVKAGLDPQGLLKRMEIAV